MCITITNKHDKRKYYFYGVDMIMIDRLSKISGNEGIFITLKGCTEFPSAEIWIDPQEWNMSIEYTD